MTRSLKGFIGLASIALLTIGTQAYACGGNQCNPSYGDGSGLAITGNIWGSGGYIGQAVGENMTHGSIIDRATLAETGGQTDLTGEVITDTCQSGNCSSRAIMSGSGNAFGRSYEFVSGTGDGSSSATQGAAALEMGVRSSLFRQPVQ